MRSAVPDVSQYPLTAGLPELRRAIADYLGRRFDVAVDPDTQVMPTSGSKEAVFNTPLAFVDRAAADLVVYPTPGYPVYERGALFAGAEVRPVVLDGDFVMRVDDVPDELGSGPAGVDLHAAQPHGVGDDGGGARRPGRPVPGGGRAVPVRRVLRRRLRGDAFPQGPASALQVSGPDFDGVLTFFSCSKRSGMTGYRSGAIVGDATAIAALRRLRTTTGTASPDFVQAAAAAAWADDDHAAVRREIFARKREILREAFDAIGIDVVESKAGLYLWVAVADDLAATDRLLEGGVVVSPGRFFGPGGEGYLRLALVPTVEECEAAVEVVQQCLTD